MTINQISVFLENKPGTLSGLTETLAENNINMRAMSLADTSDFGIARIIADNADETAALLRKNEYVVKVTPVLALEIPDEAGSLNRILKLLGTKGCNVEYMYGFTGRKTNSAYMIMRATNVSEAEKMLENSGIHLVGTIELEKV
ncbi:MAG: ACT domain-containing protein [Treponema sp.]|nr:ACT domain-containing protein [Treponema sp.]